MRTVKKRDLVEERGVQVSEEKFASGQVKGYMITEYDAGLSSRVDMKYIEAGLGSQVVMKYAEAGFNPDKMNKEVQNSGKKTKMSYLVEWT